MAHNENSTSTLIVAQTTISSDGHSHTLTEGLRPATDKRTVAQRRTRLKPAPVTEPFNINDHIKDLCSFLPPELRPDTEFSRVIARLERDPVLSLCEGMSPNKLRTYVWKAMNGERKMPTAVLQQFA